MFFQTNPSSIPQTMQRCFVLGATSKKNLTSSPQTPQPSSSSSINGNFSSSSFIINGGIKEIEETQVSNSIEEQTLISNSSNSSTSTLNFLSNEYKLAVETKSYSEIWSKFHHNQNPEDDDDEDVGIQDISSVSQVLQPNRELVNEALRRAKPTNLTRLVSDYFDQSEHTSRLCFLLHRSIDGARSLYSPLLALLEILPLDSTLTQSQCDNAFEIFHQFDLIENPFPQPNSDNFHEMRLCFSQLKQQLDHRLNKAKNQARLRSRFPTRVALCFVTLFTRPTLDVFSASYAKKQLHHIAQLDAASKGTYVLNKDLDTIDRLVTRLHGVVESDKALVRVGLGRGKDRYFIQEVVKQLCKKNTKKNTNFLNQLRDLEEHLCLCFATVNRARSLLLQEIYLQSMKPVNS